MYVLQWRTPSLDTNKGTAIQVPVGQVVSNKSSLRFTGKGSANYGAIQQENLMRLLENFAGPTAPDYPTVGQKWYDTSTQIERLCVSTSPVRWKAIAGVQVTGVGEDAPSPASVGDLWFQRTGSSSGFLYVYTGVGRYPNTASAIGGWEQIFPRTDFAAGREEYDSMLSLVNQLIGPTDVGGNAAIGKVITNLTPLTALDTSLYNAWVSRSPIDANILTPIEDSATELLVDPNSQDWDTLLAAAKYAVNRLEVPASFADDISPVPFISDGRQAPASLTDLTTTNIRYPSLERRSKRRFGLVTLARTYAETMNVLTSSLAQRYSLKGINGSSGVSGSFASNIAVAHHVQFGGALGGASTAGISMNFRFASKAARDSWINSGGAFHITMSLTSPGTTGDTNMKTLLDSRGIVRITADKTRVFANVLPLALSAAPSNLGILNGTTVTNQALAGATYSISTTNPDDTTVRVTISMSSTGAMNGTLTVKYDIIKDTETYLAPAATPVYGAPLAYASGDKVSGSASLVYQF